MREINKEEYELYYHAIITNVLCITAVIWWTDWIIPTTWAVFFFFLTMWNYYRYRTLKNIYD